MFPSLSPAARQRLAALGIDADCSYRLLQAEVAIQPPPNLVRDIGDACYVEAIDGARTQRGQALTLRELEVVQALRDGLTNAQAGVRLHLSALTVNSHHKRIYKKLGVNSRAAALRLLPAIVTLPTENGTVVWIANVLLAAVVCFGLWYGIGYLRRR